jgi:hypothetical protein
MEDINALSALAAALLAAALGVIWYSPFVFGRYLSLPSHLRHTAVRFGIGIFAMLVLFLSLAEVLVLIPFSAMRDLILPLIVGVAALLSLPVIWEEKPPAYGLIHGGYLALVLISGAVVMVLWPW